MHIVKERLMYITNANDETPTRHWDFQKEKKKARVNWEEIYFSSLTFYFQKEKSQYLHYLSSPNPSPYVVWPRAFLNSLEFNWVFLRYHQHALLGLDSLVPITLPSLLCSSSINIQT